MNRRTFLRQLAGAGIALPITLSSSSLHAFAHGTAGSPFARAMAGDNDRVLVIIRLMGGNDGLNTVVPYHDEAYYKARRLGREDNISILPEAVLPLPGSTTLGLHPAFAPIHELYGEGKVAIVQNVGYDGQAFSHFRSAEIWLSGSDASVRDEAGWLGKFFENKYPDYPQVLPRDPFAIELDMRLSLTLLGSHGAMGVALTNVDHVPDLPESYPVAGTRMGQEQEFVREVMRQSNIFSSSILAAQAKDVRNQVTYPDNHFAAKLAPIARLIAAGLGTRVYIVNLDNYDFHTNQLYRENFHHNLFSEGVAAFQRDLERLGHADRVTVLTTSEFGRRVEPTGSGTDHGGAAPLFVIGNGVRGGIIGRDPDVSDLEGPGNLRWEYDFRQVYASVLSQWFDAADTEIDRHALPRKFAQIPIFKQLSDESTPVVVSHPSLAVEQNTPNPARTRTRIKVHGLLNGVPARLSLYDSSGSLVRSVGLSVGDTEIDLDVSTLPSGTYVYEVVASGARVRRRMVVAR